MKFRGRRPRFCLRVFRKVKADYSKTTGRENVLISECCTPWAIFSKNRVKSEKSRPNCPPLPPKTRHAAWAAQTPGCFFLDGLNSFLFRNSQRRWKEKRLLGHIPSRGKLSPEGALSGSRKSDVATCGIAGSGNRFLGKRKLVFKIFPALHEFWDHRRWIRRKILYNLTFERLL